LTASRFTAINGSFGCLKASAPLTMASASLVASTSPSQTALARRIDQLTGGVRPSHYLSGTSELSGNYNLLINNQKFSLLADRS
jgi:hypothetical protein